MGDIFLYLHRHGTFSNASSRNRCIKSFDFKQSKPKTLIGIVPNRQESIKPFKLYKKKKNIASKLGNLFLQIAKFYKLPLQLGGPQQQGLSHE